MIRKTVIVAAIILIALFLQNGLLAKRPTMIVIASGGDYTWNFVEREIPGGRQQTGRVVQKISNQDPYVAKWDRVESGDRFVVDDIRNFSIPQRFFWDAGY